MSRGNLSRRNLEGGSIAEARAARHRLAATLGGAEAFGHPEAIGHPAGLLELPLDDAPDLPEGGRRPGTAWVRHRTGLRAAVLLGAVAAVLSGWFWWCVATGAPEVVPLSEVPTSGLSEPAGGADAGAAAPAGGDAAAPAARRVLVHVAGAVANPGVVELPEGSRIREAIAEAGGGTATADPDRLNLAAIVEDGQKVLVPERGEAVAPRAASDGSAGAAETGRGESGVGGAEAGSGRINLNTAGVEELGALPRVGPVLAQRIVDWRKEHGRFQAVEELDAVDGVGPKLLAALLPLVRV